MISFTDLQGLSVTCGIINAELVTTDRITRETAQQIEQLTALIEYMERRTTNPPPHG